MPGHADTPVRRAPVRTHDDNRDELVERELLTASSVGQPRAGLAGIGAARCWSPRASRKRGAWDELIIAESMSSESIDFQSTLTHMN